MSARNAAAVRAPRARFATRPIDEGDFDDVVACLMRNFPERAEFYWRAGLARLAARPSLGDYPRFGNALIAGGRVVGVLLLLHSARETPEGRRIFCNVSSWCVDAAHRAGSLLLHMQSVARPDVTYLNISPATHTRAVIETLGFALYTHGQIVAMPALGLAPRGMRVVAYRADAPEAALLSAAERAILADHAALGCRALVGVYKGEASPFVFQPRRVLKRLVSCPQLVYCRDFSEFLAFAPAIGRHLLLRSGPFCLVDAAGPQKGLAGRYFAGRFPRYFRGPKAPVVGDLAYSELVLLGQ